MVSFSVSAKAQPRLRRPGHSPTGSEESDNDEELKSNREYISEFDSFESPLETDAFKNPKNFVIPPKPNEWNPQNRHLPPQFDSVNQALQFDVNFSSVDAAADSVANGLNLRHNDNSLPAVDPTLKKLKEDLESLPDVSDDYEQVPVDGYGRALLAGYGWHEGMGIGRNSREDVKVVEFRSFSGREGLGYIAVNHPANLQQELPML